jgi:hypothetical protein
MKKESVKESLLSYMYNGRKISKLYEENGTTGPKGPKSPIKSEEEKNDPDKNAENPDSTDIMGSHNSILFLTSPDKSGIIKRGGNLGFIELTPEIVKSSGMEIDLEDYQWHCPAPEFEAYLKHTGRKYNKNSGDWTSESEETEETEEKERKISKYSDFLNEKEKSESLNELRGIPFLGNVGTNVTGKGLEYEGDDPDFQKGKLTEDQRKLVRFLFTRNHLRNNGLLKNELDLTKMKPGEEYEIYVTAFDPTTGKSDDKSMVGITFKVDVVILAQGDIQVPMVVGKIEHLAPNLGSNEGGGFSDVLEAVVGAVGSAWDKLAGVFETATGQILATIAAATAIETLGVTGFIVGMWSLHVMRISQAANALVATGAFTSDAAGVLAARRQARNSTAIGRLRKFAGGKLGNFLKYPFKKSGLIRDIKGPLRVVKNYKLYRRAAFMGKSRKIFKGFKLAKYILFGRRLAAAGRTAAQISRGARILTGVGRITNPVGWALLAIDAVGSFMNYTSDNQAPSWDPKLGGEGDAMLAYAYKGGLCPNAKNSFNPADIKVGETITLCWTQNPGSGFAAALSFVMSNSTRTTMNITKINDFPKGGLSMFLINSLNYKETWDKIKTFDLRFLFIKNGTYSEGWQDDNIGTYFLGGKVNPDPKETLPISYYGHCDFTIFKANSVKMTDQLVIVDETAPQIFYFHFEDSESNIINVTGTKITNKDLENASEEEVRSFFEVEPTSSYIGNPDDETEEEREQRESLENSARSSSDPSDGSEEEENPDSPEKVELASNENYKWYSSIEESKPITSFSEFKLIKESLLLEDKKSPIVETPEPEVEVKDEELPTGEEGEEEPPKLEDMKGTALNSQILTAKQMNKNFERVLDTIETPMAFCIYFVENREYADPELRNIYQPGSFMNFSISPDAIGASDGSNIEGGIQVNNLDVLLDAKKGLYNFSEKDRETKIKDTDIEVVGERGRKASNTILTADISSASNKEAVTPLGRGEEIKTTLQRMNPDELNQLEISDWDDITNIKIIRDRNGNPKTIKIKNRKAELGNKSRSIENGEPGWEAALSLAIANNAREAEEQKLELAKRDKR